MKKLVVILSALLVAACGVIAWLAVAGPVMPRFHHVKTAAEICGSPLDVAEKHMDGKTYCYKVCSPDDTEAACQRKKLSFVAGSLDQ